MSLLTTLVVQNSRILAGIWFIFIKKRPGPNLKSSDSTMQNVALFCNLVALILGRNCVKDLRGSKILQKSSFNGPRAS